MSSDNKTDARFLQFNYAEPRFYTETGLRSAQSFVIGQLADILYVKAPMIQSLERIAAECPTWKVKSVLLSIRAYLFAGFPLSTAMSKQTRVFPNYFVEMVRAGEETGDVLGALSEIERIMEADLELRSEFLGLTRYFSTLIAITLFLASGMIVFVLPQFEKIFSDMGAPLPAVTQTLIEVSNIFRPIFALIMLLTLAVFIFGLDRIAKWTRLDFIYGFLPGLRTLERDRRIIQFTMTLGELTRAGHSNMTSLRFLQTFDFGRGLKKAITRLEERVAAGSGLADAIRSESKLFPKPLVAVIALCEGGRNTGEAITDLARRYRRNSLMRGKMLVSIAGVVALIMTSILVMFLYLGFMMPIMNLSTII